MFKLTLAALASVAILGSAGTALAANDWITFKNNTTEIWKRTSQSTETTWGLLQNATANAGVTRSGYYTVPDRTFSSYTDTWTGQTSGKVCNFESHAQLNQFSNMQFYTSHSGTGNCATVTPGSNFSGAYTFNYSVEP